MAQLGRKCRLDWQFAHAYCVCSVDPFLCLCAWVKVYPELDHSRKFGGFTPASWTAQLRKLLAELGVQEANKYFGHDLRRGSALDVFSELPPCCSTAGGNPWGARPRTFLWMRSKLAAGHRAWQTTRSPSHSRFVCNRAGMFVIVLSVRTVVPIAFDFAW